MNPLKFVNWNITNECNLNCIYCSYSSGKEMEGELTTLEAKNIIDQLAKMNCKQIGISGGEPLIRSDVFKLFEFAKSNKIKISLLTNGTLIQRKNIRLLKKYVDYINISIAGLTKKENDYVRGKGSFSLALKTLKLCKKNKIPTGVFFTVTKANVQHLEELVNFVEKYSVSKIKVIPVIKCGRAINYWNELCITRQELEKAYKGLIKRLVRIYGTKPWYGDWCNAGINNLFIDPVGNVYPCADPLSFTIPLGNLKKESLRDIWKKSPILQQIRAERKKCKKIKCMYKYAIIKNFDIVKFSGEVCYFKRADNSNTMSSKGTYSYL